MDFVSDKLTSLTAPALSKINEQRRREKTTSVRSSRNSLNADQPLSGGFLFGGESSNCPQAPRPPPIGFNLTTEDRDQANSNEQNQVAAKPGRADSEESLYETDSWSRLWFQRVLILTFLRLLLFIRKVYEDFHATKAYSAKGNKGHFLISLATLFLPTLVFTIYRVSRYLQTALKTGPSYPQRHSNGLAQVAAHQAINSPQPQDNEAEQQQLQQQRQQQILEEENLVTARNTPTQLEDFHDSRSQNEEETGKTADELARHVAQVIVEQPIAAVTGETIRVEKLGNLPDRESVRIIIGSSEQLLHGILFIFWQLKRQVDVVSYLVERSCLWRKPRDIEKEELDKLRTGSDGLEWFQDFYAAFLAILAQIYTLGNYWNNNGTSQANAVNAMRNSAASTGALGSLAAIESSELSISKSAQVLSETIRQQAIAGNLSGERDLLILSEMIVSSAVIFSLLIAVRRKDDGPLTLGLSMLGWGSIFASRIIIIALAFVYFDWKIMVALILTHILGLTGWIYKIAIDSHNGKKSERVDESKWIPGEQEDNERTREQSIELRTKQPGGESAAEVEFTTSNWSWAQHLVLLAQILTLFAIPSLFYWPIMFNLKSHSRPFKYLVLILIENFIFIPLIWFSLPTGQATSSVSQLYLLGGVGGFSIVGFIFITLYISCKPSLTEYFARADELFNEADRSGIYYEFCSRVFKMPDLSKQNFRRLMRQTEEIIEEADE